MTEQIQTVIYSFVPAERCNMCGAGLSRAKIIGRRLNDSQGLRPRGRIGITVTVMRCRRCGLVFANPQPRPSDVAQHYGVPPEEYWPPEYFHDSDSYFSSQIDTFSRLRGKKPPKGPARVLDVGAGLGKAVHALLHAGFDVWALEPSRPFCERAREATGLGADRLIEGSVEDAEFEDGFFDCVFFSAVLEHLYDPSAVLARAVRWLRPGGWVHVEVPSSSWLTGRIVNAAYRLQGLDYAANLSPMHVPFHLFEFRLRSFQEHARAHGYAVAYHTSYVCQTYLPRLADPILKPAMALTGTGMQLEVWLQREGQCARPPPRRA